MPRSIAPAAVIAIASLCSGAASASTRAQAALPNCQPVHAGGPLFISPQCSDPKLNTPYVDLDKPGSTTDPVTGVTVHYRYVHGGFTGSQTRFSFYFPIARDYRGWFIEETYPTVTQEDAGPGTIAFGISHGAYVVSTNNNGGVVAGGLIAGYRANAAASNFSRIEAARVYGHIARPRGFIFGASGGAYQTLGAAENSSGVWDGSVPMVPGVPNAIPSFQGIQLLALRGLGDVLPQIADAMEPGGSGDPFAGLTPAQQSTLREVSRMGFPLRGWWQYASLNGGAFLAVEGGAEAIDSKYVTDFWTKPGYEGSNPSVNAARVQASTKVVRRDGKVGLVLESVPSGYLVDADLVVADGPMAGTTLKIVSVTGNTIQLASNNGVLANAQTNESNAGMTPGTTVKIDNSWMIALQFYARHQVPTPDQYGWNQYRDAAGKPQYPQRSILVGPMLDAFSSGGAVATGHFHGKMIMLASDMDVQAYSWGADWYKKQAEATSGPDLKQSYRLWFMNNADHDPRGPVATTAANAADHIVSYEGEYQQALLYLNEWVARGTAPPVSTNYHIDGDTQTIVTGKAAQRGGVQPIVTLSVGGGEKVDVRAGQSVTFTMTAQMPPNAGRIVKVAWDPSNTGTFSGITPVNHPANKLTMTKSYTFTESGTYFPTVRISSVRAGDVGKAASPYARVQNLARVRVVVH